MWRVVAFFGALSLIGACAASPDKPSATRTATFVCEGGRSISLAFEEGEAVMTGVGRAVRLRQEAAASGIHYSGGGHDLRGKGWELTWTDPSGSARACRDTTAPGLAGSSWRLVSFQSPNGPVIPPRAERYLLTFAEGGALNARLDCNQTRGRWDATASSPASGSLKLSGGAMTRAFCGEGAIDTQLAADFGRVRTYTLANGLLTLSLDGGGGYVWSPAAAPR